MNGDAVRERHVREPALQSREARETLREGRSDKIANLELGN